VLNPFGRIDQHIMDDSDVAGPILFFLVFGTSLLVCRKLPRDLEHITKENSSLASFISDTSMVGLHARNFEQH
jgi:hypothetical protein